MQNKPIKKLYYSISDVSKLTEVKQHVLRYWETEFSELRPNKNRAGNRTYKLKEIKIIFLIKRLLYQEKFTIEGAKIRLKELLKSEIDLNITDLDHNKNELKSVIGSIRTDLMELDTILFEKNRGVAQSG